MTCRQEYGGCKEEGPGKNPEEPSGAGVVPGVGAEHPQRSVLPAQPGAHAREALHLHLHGRLHGCAPCLIIQQNSVKTLVQKLLQMSSFVRVLSSQHRVLAL